MRVRLLAALLLWLTATCAQAAELKIATWNLNWLTGRGDGDRALPADVRARVPGDFDLLRRYADDLDADVIAIQEVDNGGTALRLFPPERYSVRMARDRVLQRVGIVVRRGIPYDVNPDVAALALDPAQHLRSGVDITLRLPGGKLRLLALHLKRGCQYQNLRKPSGQACIALHDQIAPLQEWMAARANEGIPFVVLGDFNREMDGRDPFMAALRQTTPLLRSTEGSASPCWGKEAFVDHIMLGGGAQNWLQSGSLRVLTYRETERSWKDRLSDHCPVSIRLVTPE